MSHFHFSFATMDGAAGTAASTAEDTSQDAQDEPAKPKVSLSIGKKKEEENRHIFQHKRKRK